MAMVPNSKPKLTQADALAEFNVTGLANGDHLQPVFFIIPLMVMIFACRVITFCTLQCIGFADNAVCNSIIYFVSCLVFVRVFLPDFVELYKAFFSSIGFYLVRIIFSISNLYLFNDVWILFLPFFYKRAMRFFIFLVIGARRFNPFVWVISYIRRANFFVALLASRAVPIFVSSANYKKLNWQFLLAFSTRFSHDLIYKI
jgi:hypothetical protein